MSPHDPERRDQQNEDLGTVESRRNELIPQEFPEGPYGSPAPINSSTLGDRSPWREDQHAIDAFDYENRELHAGLDRDYPGDRDVDDEV